MSFEEKYDSIFRETPNLYKIIFFQYKVYLVNSFSSKPFI